MVIRTYWLKFKDERGPWRRARLFVILTSSLVLTNCLKPSTVDSQFRPFLKTPEAFELRNLTGSGTQATLSWSESKGATSYTVRYGTSSGSYPTVVSTNATSPLVIPGITPGSSYFFRVEAKNDSAETSVQSKNELALTVSEILPTALDSIRLTWAAQPSTTYRIVYGTSAGSHPTEVTNVTPPHTITGLSQGQDYFLLLIGTDNLGATTTSSEFAATVPSLLLDFTASETLDASITYTRGGMATRTNSTGLVERVAFNSSRFDYGPTDLAAKGMLLEESRQNLIKRSEDLEKSAWTGVGQIVTADVATAPDGTTTAEKMVADTSTGNHRIGTVSLTKPSATNLTYTFSTYFKPAGYPGITLLLRGATFGDNAKVTCSSDGNTYNLTTSGSGWTAVSSGVASVGNGWYRCFLVSTTDTFATMQANLMGWNGDTSTTSTTFTGDGTSGVLLWGPQIELGSNMTSYIPTTNTLSYSEEIDNAVWAGTRLTVTANNTTAPDGTTTADLLVDNATANTHFTRQVVSSLISNQPLTFAFYAKKSGLDKIQAKIVDSATTTNFAAGTFDLTNGTSSTSVGGTGTATSSSITSVGNGWFRCVISGTPTTASVASVRVDFQLLNAAGSSSYAGAGTGLFVWGAQLEVGSSVSLYGKATDNPIRDADSAVIGTLGAWFSASNGTILSKSDLLGTPGAGESHTTIAFTDGTAANSVSQVVTSTGASARVVKASAAQTDATVAFTPTGTLKVASAYAANDLAIAGNNTAGTDSTNANLPVPTRCVLGADSSGNRLNGHLKLFQFAPARASSAALKSMSN